MDCESTKRGVDEWFHDPERRYVHETVALRVTERLTSKVFESIRPEIVMAYMTLVEVLAREHSVASYLPYFDRFRGVPDAQLWDALRMDSPVEIER